jgi:hypothetical protein
MSWLRRSRVAPPVASLFVFPLALLVAGLLSACGSLPLRSDAPRFDPLRVLSETGEANRWTSDQASRVIEDIALARRRHAQDLQVERAECHRGLLIAACLEQVAHRERLLDDRLDALEVAAQQRLRDLAARARSEREVRETRARDRDTAENAEQEARQRERYERRQQEAQRAQAEREAQAPALRQREQQATDRQRAREQAFESRKSTAVDPPRP